MGNAWKAGQYSLLATDIQYLILYSYTHIHIY